MKPFTDEEVLSRLSYSDGITSDMIESFERREWAAVNSVALALYAQNGDDPIRLLEDRLDTVGWLIWVYGRRMPEWCSLNTLVDCDGLTFEPNEWDSVFINSQDYLSHIIGLYERQYNGITPDVFKEIGNHLVFALATACMAFIDSKDVLEQAREIASLVLESIIRDSHDIEA